MRSQISVFMIIGFVVLVVIGFLLLLTSNLDPEQNRRSGIQTHMDTCMQQHAEKLMHRIGMYSGFYEPIKQIATIEQTEQIITEQLKKNIQDCLNIYTHDEQQSIGEPITKIVFGDSTVITIKDAYKHSTKTSETINIEMPIRYRYIRDLAQQMSENTLVTDTFSDINVEIAEGDELLWLLTDKSNNVPYYFSFKT